MLICKNFVHTLLHTIMLHLLRIFFVILSDQEILSQLEKERMLVFTPSRHVGGRRLVCYDDRYILRLAVDSDGIVVSNDNYRDLANENPEFKKIIEERLLMYSFVNDRLVFILLKVISKKQKLS